MKYGTTTHSDEETRHQREQWGWREEVGSDGKEVGWTKFEQEG